MIRRTLRQVAPAVLTSVAIALGSGLVALPAVEGATTLKPGFVKKRIATGLVNPVDMAFAPDGRLFVAEQSGRVRIVREDGSLSTFLNIRSKVNSKDERGLLGIAFDADFTTNQFVYLDYTRKATASVGVHNRVVRVRADGDKAVPGSEKLLLRLNTQRSSHHIGGTLGIGRQGKLFIGSGDDQVSGNAQKLTNLFGKILRINTDGTIPTSNPFRARTTGRNRAIWARGLRNPFKMAFQPGTGTLFINDVGEQTWEEIDRGARGANYGWPIHEGAESDPSYAPPVFAYAHGSSGTRGCAITGGVFYNPAKAQFPAGHVGDYFYADFCSGWIRRYDVGTDTSKPFAKGFANPVVDLEVNTTGALFALVRGTTGSVVRIRHP